MISIQFDSRDKRMKAVIIHAIWLLDRAGATGRRHKQDSIPSHRHGRHGQGREKERHRDTHWPFL